MKFGKYIVYGFLVTLLVTAGITLYWLYGSAKVLQVHNNPVPVRPPTQKSDEIVFLIVNYCKTRPATGTVRRFLISNTVRIPLPLQTDSGPQTCQQTNVPLLVPKAVVPDTYHIHIDVDYQINPLRKITESFDSQTFVIE